jgi:uncharacterized membrane protein
MPEIIQIALATFLRLSIGFALVYGMYRLISLAISHLPEGLFGKSKEETWDGARLVYSVPSSVIGFIILDLLIVFFFAGFASRILDSLFSLPGEIRDLVFLLGCAGIFSLTVFGLYQDHPPTRLKLLGWIAVIAAVMRMG